MTEKILGVLGGMGPLAGKIWRIGLMGAGATAEHVDVLVAGLEAALKRAGQPTS